MSVATSFRNLDPHNSPEGVTLFEINPFATLYSVPHSLSFPVSRIHKLVRERRIDVIHALMDYSTNTAAASLVSKATDVPFVYNVQGMGTRTGRFLIDTLAECYDWTVERFISGNAEKLILLSRSLISRTRKLGVADDRVLVIPSGVDCARFDPEIPEVKRKAAEFRKHFRIAPDDVVIGYVGRLVPAKGLSYLLAAAETIKHEFSNVVLLFVGAGPQMTELQLRAKALDLKTVFAGYQTDTPPYYALMDVFVLPSLFEGLPGVVLEAMAMERPIIATNVGGTSDLVIDGKNGFLIPSKDSEKIASSLRKLLGNQTLRGKMGRVGREIVQNGFQWDDIVGKVETVYKEVVSH